MNCQQCGKEITPMASSMGEMCQECYDSARSFQECANTRFHIKFCKDCRRIIEIELQDIGENGFCGKPENHNNGDTEGCVECAVIKNNV